MQQRWIAIKSIDSGGLTGTATINITVGGASSIPTTTRFASANVHPSIEAEMSKINANADRSRKVENISYDGADNPNTIPRNYAAQIVTHDVQRIVLDYPDLSANLDSQQHDAWNEGGSGPPMWPRMSFQLAHGDGKQNILVSVNRESDYLSYRIEKFVREEHDGEAL